MKADAAVLAQYRLVVLDTNVLLSAALSPGGAPSLLVDRVLQVGKLVYSDATFAELEARIWLPKFDRYLSMERRRSLLRDVNGSAYWVNVSAGISSLSYSRDAKDDAFIHAAMAAGASRLVTGDDDLLCPHPLGEIQILSPRRALNELEAAAPSAS